MPIKYIEDITRWREDINFMFEWQEQYLTSERRERVRYCSCHKNIKFELTCIVLFTITTEMHARSLANFYCQYADRHINLKFMRRVSDRERAIRQYVIVKNKLMSFFNASVLLLTMSFVITLSK